MVNTEQRPENTERNALTHTDTKQMSVDERHESTPLTSPQQPEMLLTARQANTLVREHIDVMSNLADRLEQVLLSASSLNRLTSSSRASRGGTGRGQRPRGTGRQYYGQMPTRAQTREEIERARRIHERELGQRQEGYDRDVERDPTPLLSPNLTSSEGGRNAMREAETTQELNDTTPERDATFTMPLLPRRRQRNERARGTRSEETRGQRVETQRPFRVYVDPPPSQPARPTPEVYFGNPDRARWRGQRAAQFGGEDNDDVVFPNSTRYPYLQVLHRGWTSQPSCHPVEPLDQAPRQQFLSGDHAVAGQGTREATAARRLDFPTASRFPERWRLPENSLVQPGRRQSQQIWKQKELVPVFEGSVEEYSSWAPLFYEFVHSQPLSTAFKFSVLQKTLSPHVRSLVMVGLDMSEISYAIVFERLEKYYGGSERWSQSVLEPLERPSRLRPNDWGAARQFLDRVEAYTATSSPTLNPCHDGMMMALIRRNVPEDWYTQFQTWCIHCQIRPDVRNFLRWASALVDPHLGNLPLARGRVHFEDTETEMIDNVAMLGTVRSGSPEAQEVRSPSPVPIIVCPCCSGHHVLKRCEEFLYLSPERRKGFALEHGWCLVCLGSGHVAERCYSAARCALCWGRHHTLVHVRRPIAADDTGGAGVQETSRATLTSGSTFQGYINTSQLWSANRGQAVSVSFIVAALRNPLTEQTVLINVLLDMGANNSSITQKLADMLLLSGERESYVLEVSGGS